MLQDFVLDLHTNEHVNDFFGTAGWIFRTDSFTLSYARFLLN